MARTIAKDHDQKRAEILKSAARVFAAYGFDRASMSDLARECGISKANIYHYYNGKDALLFDILDTKLSNLRNRMFALDLNGKTAAEKLHMLTREILLAYEGYDDEHKIQTGGFHMLPDEQQKVLRSYQREMVSLLSETIAETAPAKFADQPLKLRSVTMSVFGMLNWFYMWNTEADQKAREDYAATVANLTLAGVSGV